MGGYGSGRPSYRNKVEDYRRLDANHMHRAGVFNRGRIGGWQWTVDGERVAHINYAMEDSGLRLMYRSRSWGDDWQDRDYFVPLDWRPCHYGGTRPYFRCPGVRNGRYCGRSVIKLYGGALFLCRHCHDLAYRSQSESMQDRLLRKANKKRMALGGEPGTDSWLPERPKGMWQRTYEREIDAILDAEELADRLFALWVFRRFGTTDVSSLF